MPEPVTGPAAGTAAEGVPGHGAPGGAAPYRYAPDDHVAGRFQLIPAAYVVLRRGAPVGRGARVGRPAPADPGVQVLLQLRQGTGYMDGHWACGAAGHVEAGESVLAAAYREGREELGIELGDLEPLTAMHRTVSGAGPIDQRVDFFFACDRWRGEPALREPDKAADLRWFSLDALPSPVVPHEELVLAGLRDGTLPGVTTWGFA